MQQNDDGKKENKQLAGYSLFTDVEDTRMRAYNRCAILVNIRDVDNKELSLEYFKAIPEEDHVDMIAMAGYIRAKGFEKTLREIKEG